MHDWLQELVQLHKQYHDKGLEIMAWQVFRESVAAAWLGFRKHRVKHKCGGVPVPTSCGLIPSTELVKSVSLPVVLCIALVHLWSITAPAAKVLLQSTKNWLNTLVHANATTATAVNQV